MNTIGSQSEMRVLEVSEVALVGGGPAPVIVLGAVSASLFLIKNAGSLVNGIVAGYKEEMNR